MNRTSLTWAARSLAAPAVAALVAAVLAAPTLASAESFRNGDLLAERGVKQSSEDRRFSFGLGFSIAPVKALIKSQANKALDKYAADNPEGAAMRDYIQYADTAQMRALADSGDLPAFKQALKDEIKKNGGTLSTDQEKAIDGMDEGKLRAMADMIEIMQDPDDTLTFALEPWVAYNFEWLQIRAFVGVAGFHGDTGTSFQVGNLGLDLSTGGRLGPMGRRLGWTLGVRGYAPTATTDANAMALANVLQTPRYLHEYATVTPYATLGLDLGVLVWTLRGNYNHMIAVRGKDVGVNDMAYVQAGTGLLLILRWVGISAELDGLFEIKDAPMMANSWLLTGGVHGYLGPVQLGGGVQIPLVRPGSKDERFRYGGVATGSPADINFIIQSQIHF